MNHWDPSLYLVTDRSICRHKDWVEAVREAVAGGVTLVQLREKNKPTQEVVECGRALLKVLRPLGVPLVVNDFIEVAEAIEADGVHLGATDASAAEARRRLGPDAVIGVSLVANQGWVESTVDYVAVSPVFPTQSKTDLTPFFGLEGVKGVRRQTRLPLIAIGGIHSENAAAVLEAGADGLAVISAILASDDPRAAALRLKQVILEFRGSRVA